MSVQVPQFSEDEPMRPVDGIMPQRREAKRHNQCVFDITHDASTFRDALSAKEYTITGMCQGCQDSFFGA
jgi:hypothetical protein